MRYCGLLLTLPALTLAASRIIGGKTVAITDYPYQLSLRRQSQHICGAAILNETVAITAAHCLEKSGAYSIKAGSSSINQNSDGTVVHVNIALVHPYYNRATSDNDIALLFLATPLIFNDRIASVALPPLGAKVKQGMVGHVTGWGAIDWSKRDLISEDLREVEVPILGWGECKKVYFYILNEKMFCAGVKAGGKDSCLGDSGGPFVVQGVLYGLVSSGFECGQPGYPGIYTNVPALRSFIFDFAKF